MRIKKLFKYGKSKRDYYKYLIISWLLTFIWIALITLVFILNFEGILFIISIFILTVISPSLEDIFMSYKKYLKEFITQFQDEN